MNAPEKQFAMAAKAGTQLLPLSLNVLGSFDAVIDVRSPGEYAEDHLPGAVNFPVLNDQERIQVGTLYKQSSAFDAKKLGAAMVARNIASHIETSFLIHPKGWKPLIYCWRGGSRSGAMSHILRSIGWPALQLEGGYKAWRGQVLVDLEALPGNYSYKVICGRTGSGKSRLLDAMANNGQQVLDLEKMAAHKGSVLGDLPGEPQPAQKRFESLIWEALSKFSPDRPVYVEAESKKVGSLRVPDGLIRRMRESPCYDLATPQPLRIQLLREEYTHLIANRELLFAKLDSLKPLHSSERVEAWKSLAKDGRWDEFVTSMLVEHYDPAYARSMFQNFVQAKNATSLPVEDISLTGFLKVASTLPG